MASFGFFQVPADDIGRAKTFYQSLLGWTIEPDTHLENKDLQWHTITSGRLEPGRMHSGGLYRRMGGGTIMNFAIVEDVEYLLAKVEKLGGKTVLPKTDIPHVGTVAVVQDTEGNTFGLLKPLTV